MSDEPKYRDEEWLREQYVDQRRTTTDIADELGCSANTVRRWLKKHGIETRQGGCQCPDERLEDADWLREQYVDQRRTTTDIADELGCHASTVRRWLKKHGIETRQGGWQCPDERLEDADWLREQYVEREWTIYDIADELECSATLVCRCLKEHGIETRKGGGQFPDERLKDADWLREQYVERERSSCDIADELECSATAVQRWLKEHGIETRRGVGYRLDERVRDAGWLREQYVERERSTHDIADELECSAPSVQRWLKEHGIEARNKAPTGPENPSWRGGEAPYGPGWTPAKRRQVRERDDHTCQDPTCSVTQDDHLDQYDEKLHVHHLIKARDIDDPEKRNAPENLITLCRDCHHRWERLSEAGIRPQIDGVTAD